MSLIPRTAQKVLTELAGSYPALVVTGPRQSGKTTLTRVTFPDKPYVSLEDPDVRAFATEDPRGFLNQYSDGAILDEVQRCPDLFSYLQSHLDEAVQMGLFILTGSQNFDLVSGITQSLAGRVAKISLLPFSLHELQDAGRAPGSLKEFLFKGLYPPIYDRNLDPQIWYSNYADNYVERDVRQLINVRDLGTFQRFVRMCAARTAQILNLSSLAGDCGVSHNTAKAWISVLEASYVIQLLQPHFENFNKRLIKSPKLYFLDPGLVTWLLGIQTPEQLATHSARGQIFESWFVSEALKYRYNSALKSNLYFWRDSRGNEVDVLIDRANKLVPIELKSGQTVAGDFFSNLKKFNTLAGDAAGRGILVYGGDQAQTRESFDVVPWQQIDSLSNVLAN